MDTQKWNIMARHLAGESTPDEEDELQQWLRENPENEELYQETVRNWELSAGAKPYFDADKAFDKFLENSGQAAKVRAINTEGTQRHIISFMKIAAALALLIVSVILAYNILNLSDSNVTVATTSGETRDVRLPDGTFVALNENSSITYPREFNNQRNITFEGEGYFEVKKDEQKPFSITTSQTVTTVLGTSFNLKDHQNKNPQIKLFTGRVSFEDKTSNEKVVLSPGQQAVLEKEGIRVGDIDGSNDLAWKTKKLEFNQAPLEVMAADLEDYFNMEVLLSDPALKKCEFTGTFENPDLAEILQALEFTNGIKATINKDTITLSGQGCQ